jgi:hypothetical protein
MVGRKKQRRKEGKKERRRNKKKRHIFTWFSWVENPRGETIP